MIAREWKARCSEKNKEDFISYLYETGVKETSETEGCMGTQIFTRKRDQDVEITLISYWDSYESIKVYSGDDIDTARLYPEDDTYELDPDLHVTHYTVIENSWLQESTIDHPSAWL